MECSGFDPETHGLLTAPFQNVTVYSLRVVIHIHARRTGFRGFEIPLQGGCNQFFRFFEEITGCKRIRPEGFSGYLNKNRGAVGEPDMFLRTPLTALRKIIVKNGFVVECKW